MKVGILTRRYGYNMGSTLQEFAIMQLIRDQGHDVEVMKYDETSAHWRWKIRPIVEYIQYKFKLSFSNKKTTYLKQRFLQEKIFSTFEKKYITLSQKSLKSTKTLNKQSQNYDKIVIGSDQIWNPYFFDSHYFGSFIPGNEKNKIIAYAPSIGTSNESIITTKQIELIKSLKYISCREDKGAEIIGKFIGRSVPVVLDPTLMINEDVWYKIADEHKISDLPQKYILTYFLGSNIPTDRIKALGSLKNAQIINVSVFNRINDIDGARVISNAGPGEFLYLIKNASHIITDSFHGSIFSHIFKREYTVVERFKEDDLRNENSRIYTLLETFGELGNLYGRDLKNTNGYLQSKREKSLSFLLNALNSKA